MSYLENGLLAFSFLYFPIFLYLFSKRLFFFSGSTFIQYGREILGDLTLLGSPTSPLVTGPSPRCVLATMNCFLFGTGTVTPWSLYSPLPPLPFHAACGPMVYLPLVP